MEPLDKISKQLEKQNEILQRMLDIMPRPSARWEKIAETGVIIAAFAGLAAIADLFLKIFIGG